jgi:hypothetical protein
LRRLPICVAIVGRFRIFIAAVICVVIWVVHAFWATVHFTLLLPRWVDASQGRLALSMGLETEFLA